MRSAPVFDEVLAGSDDDLVLVAAVLAVAVVGYPVYCARIEAGITEVTPKAFARIADGESSDSVIVVENGVGAQKYEVTLYSSNTAVAQLFADAFVHLSVLLLASPSDEFESVVVVHLSIMWNSVPLACPLL